MAKHKEKEVKSGIQLTQGIREMSQGKPMLGVAFGKRMKIAMLILLVASTLGILFLGLGTNAYVGIAVGGMLLALPILVLVQNYFLDMEVSRNKKNVVFVLIVALILATGYPLITPLLPGRFALDASFSKVGESFNITPQTGGEREWMVDVEGTLEPVEAPYDVPYVLRIGDRRHTLIKGSLYRGWDDATAKDRQLIDVESRRHTLSIDLGGNPTLELVEQNGPLVGPLKVTIHKPTVPWIYLLLVGIPLLLVGAAIDLSEAPKIKQTLVSNIVGFMLIFSFTYAIHFNAEAWFGPALLSLLGGVVGAFFMGWAAPTFLGPIAKRLPGVK